MHGNIQTAWQTALYSYKDYPHAGSVPNGRIMTSTTNHMRIPPTSNIATAGMPSQLHMQLHMLVKKGVGEMRRTVRLASAPPPPRNNHQTPQRPRKPFIHSYKQV